MENVHILIFTLNFKGGSQCYSCLTGLFKTVPLNSSSTSCPVTHHYTGQPNIPVIKEPLKV